MLFLNKRSKGEEKFVLNFRYKNKMDQQNKLEAY